MQRHTVPAGRSPPFRPPASSNGFSAWDQIITACLHRPGCLARRGTPRPGAATPARRGRPAACRTARPKPLDPDDPVTEAVTLIARNPAGICGRASRLRLDPVSSGRAARSPADAEAACSSRSGGRDDERGDAAGAVAGGDGCGGAPVPPAMIAPRIPKAGPEDARPPMPRPAGIDPADGPRPGGSTPLDPSHRPERHRVPAAVHLVPGGGRAGVHRTLGQPFRRCPTP